MAFPALVISAGTTGSSTCSISGLNGCSARQQLTPKDAQRIAKNVSGVDFSLKHTMPVWMLGWVIALLRFFTPGKKDEVMPMWVVMQYPCCSALGVMSPPAPGQ